MNVATDITDLFLGSKIQKKEHDDDACKAYCEYMKAVEKNQWVNLQGRRQLPKGQRIDDIAKKHGTSKFQMKKHWMCYERFKNKET